MDLCGACNEFVYPYNVHHLPGYLWFPVICFKYSDTVLMKWFVLVVYVALIRSDYCRLIPLTAPVNVSKPCPDPCDLLGLLLWLALKR